MSGDEKKKKEKKKPSRYIEALIPTSLILLERFRRNKFNIIKKYHQRRPEWVTLAAKNK